MRLKCCPLPLGIELESVDNVVCKMHGGDIPVLNHGLVIVGIKMAQGDSGYDNVCT